MAFVRAAKKEDMADFYRLWKVCFGDSDAFCDWFFQNRFAPEYSVVLETEGEVASCMQAFPYTLHIRGKEVPGAMLCGVSTHPDHRQKGYMGQIFRYEMNLLRNKGCMVAPHTPAVLPSYFSFGHFPVADAAYLECECVPPIETSIELVSIEEKDWDKLFPLYQRLAAKYSGIIQRTEEDFFRKASDYAADGGKCAAYIMNDEMKGYAFYYQTEDSILCVEAAAADGYYHYLIEGLFALGKGLSFSAKLPPNIYLSFPFGRLTRKQKGVMGLCNAPALLKALNLNIPYGFRIRDAVVPENNGVFDFKGSTYIDEPAFEISAGHLLQVLVGYHSLCELEKEILVFDRNKFDRINALLPKQNCYIIDEY